MKKYLFTFSAKKYKDFYMNIFSTDYRFKIKEINDTQVEVACAGPAYEKYCSTIIDSMIRQPKHYHPAEIEEI